MIDYRLAHAINKKYGLKEITYYNSKGTDPVCKEYGAQIIGPHHKYQMRKAVFRTIGSILEDEFGLDAYEILWENNREHNIGIYWRVRPEFLGDGNGCKAYFRVALIQL